MNKKYWREIGILAILAAFSICGYLYFSLKTYTLGFSLDDAWIHQTYARNIAYLGEWTFITGVPSGGSTSPLWSSLLAIGYFLDLDPYGWTFFLGWLSLSGISMIGVLLYKSLYPEIERFSIWLGSLLVLEWHLVWAAVSGMETLLFSFVVIVSMWLIISAKTEVGIRWFIVGIVIGLGVWVRPDGITLVGPALWVILLLPYSQTSKLRASLILVCGFSLFFGPYLVFNQVVAGSIWPNTFFAKQAEYAELKQIPLLIRILRQFQLPLVGIGAVLIPGFFLYIRDIFKQKNWQDLAPILWLFGFLLLYAIRLPVTYQHGRYVIPVMPVCFIIGFTGMSQWLHESGAGLIPQALSKSWIWISVLITGIFWILGAKAYADDVAVIESEMVFVAHWLNQNTPEDVLIAAHDIGAIGYFGDRKLVDLAGLISPDVIPFIRDEDQLGAYLDSLDVDYLVTFPEWYPSLVNRSILIFQTDGAFSPSLGGENMAVYQWLNP